MRGFKSRALALAAFGVSLLGIVAPAGATIYNIAADDADGIDVNFAAGTYLIKWIGIADGGLYDAANVTLCTPTCTTGFSNAFIAGDQDFGSNDYELEIFTTAQVYGTAADSLAAYKSGNNIRHNTVNILNGQVVNTTFKGFIPNPWIATLDGGPGHLLVLDFDGNRANNSGGVSLSIELLPVPEPASWALMIAGFGMAGAALRRRSVARLAMPA